MATKVNVVAGSSTAKAIVLVSALGTGLAMSQLVKAKPTWGMPMTLVLGAGGVAGAMYLEGAWGEVSMGVASACMATLGASIPTLMSGNATGRRAAGPAALSQGRNTGVPTRYDWRDSLPQEPKV